MKHLTFIISLFICSSVYADRLLCMCCDDNRQVVEIIIESCEEAFINKYTKLNNRLTYTDLIISGIVTASIPNISLNDSIPSEVKSGTEEIKKYVYEERDGTSCNAFKKGNKLLMITNKVMCGGNIEGDIACLNEGNIAKFLPEKYLKLIKENEKNKSGKTK